MMADGYVGRRETTTLVVLLIIHKQFLVYPRVIAEENLNAGWLVLLLSGILALAVFGLYAKLMQRFPGKTLVEIPGILFGYWATWFTGWFLCLIITFNMAIKIRLFSEIVVGTILTDTPIEVIIGVMLLSCLLLARCGLEGITRLSWYFFPWSMIVILIGLLSSGLKGDPVFLFPLFGPGLDVLLTNSLLRVSTYLEIIFLLLFYPFFRKHQAFQKTGNHGILLSILLAAFIQAVFSMVFPFSFGDKPTIPLYDLYSAIHFGPFFQRIESIFILVWTAIILIVMSLMLWGASVCITAGNKLREFRPALPALAALSFIISLMPENNLLASRLATEVYHYWPGNLLLLPPLLLLLAAKFKGIAPGGKGK